MGLFQITVVFTLVELIRMSWNFSPKHSNAKMHEREVTFAKTSLIDTNEPKLEAIGGYHLDYPWLMPERLVIYHIKNKIEKYFIRINGRKMLISVAKCGDKDCLIIEGDSFPSKSLFRLPGFPSDFPEIDHIFPWAL